MLCQDGGPGSTTGSAVPSEVLTRTVAQTDIATIKHVRCAAVALRDTAAAAVKGLIARESRLPPRAWRAFPFATRLHCTGIRARSSSSQKRRHQNQLADHEVEIMSELFASVPARVEYVSISDTTAWSSAQSLLLARALLTAAFSSTLQHLSLTASISRGAADMLLQGLPQLRAMEVDVKADAVLAAAAAAPAAAGDGVEQPVRQQWRPASPSLESLMLKAGASIALDITALGAAGKLRSLDLQAGTFIAPPFALLGLSSTLTSLCMRAACSGHKGEPAPEYLPGDLAFLRGLAELRSLELGDVYSNATGWCSLVSLAQLTHLHLASIEVPLDVPEEEAEGQWAVEQAAGQVPDVPQPRAPDEPAAGGSALAAAAATAPRLQASLVMPSLAQLCITDDGPFFPEDDQRVPGCLARLLPSLADLQSYNGDMVETLEELQGHAALCSLLLWVPCSQVQPALQPGHFASLAGLKQLTLGGVDVDMGQLLAAVAGCPVLEELELLWDEEDAYQLQLQQQQGRQQQELQRLQRTDWDMFPRRYRRGGAKGRQGQGQEEAPQGLAALAAGRCSKTLRLIKPSFGWVFGPEEVAALLQGGMPALQEVRVGVEVPRCWVDEEVVAERLPQLLALCGATVAVKVKDGVLHDMACRWFTRCELLVVKSSAAV